LRILLGITGGIAAYKATGLVRAFRELGHFVSVVPTENALRFVGKTTLEALSGENIDIDMYSDVAQVRHVELGQQADLIVVAPATASFLSRLATGLADDLLTNAILASKAPVVLVPAMHSEMWLNPATKSNVATLASRGIRVMEPASGRLTGEDSGVGRMPEVEQIVDFCFGNTLSGKTVVVTAGGTRESIDEVRFIGNRSSGRMGIEIAKAARDAGAKVKLIACNLETVPAGMEVVHVATVDDLEHAMDAPADAIIMAAAVSDFRVVAFTLADDQQNLESVSAKKLWDKGVSLMIGNTTEVLGAQDTKVLMVSRESVTSHSGSKAEVARLIVDRIANHFVG